MVDGFEPARLRLGLAPAELAQPLQRIAPGLHSFALVAPPGSGGTDVELEVLFDGAVIVSKRLSIAVDRHVATDGVAARGGCTFARGSVGAGSAWLAALLAIGALRAQKRYRRTR